MHCARVLALIVLLVGLVQIHCFSWDVVVGNERQLEFYNNGTLTHTEDVVPSPRYILSVTYDPIHYRLLFSDFNQSTKAVSSFDLSTRKIQNLVNISSNYYTRVAYDTVTETVFWKDGFSILSFSLNPASSNKANGNVVVTLGNYCRDLAVESCGGYIYWITDYEIERARFDGSDREVLIDEAVYDRTSLAIDRQPQKVYWTEKTVKNGQVFIKSADFDGKNAKTLYIVRNAYSSFSLTVSKDFIYWQNLNEQGIWQLPKYSSDQEARKLHSVSASSSSYYHRVAINYTIEDLQGVKSCDALQGLIPHDSKSESTVSVCQNYCFQGECGVSAEGRPTCSCMIGFSGDRCEVNACHQYCLNGGVCSLNEEDEPACQCAAGYDGGRCEVSANKDNSCDADTEKEKISACHQFCLNNGVCSLNEAGEPVCQCSADHEGVRCEVAVDKDLSFQLVATVLKGQPKVTVTVGRGVESTCTSTTA